jgi:TrkA-N domain./Ion channel.
LLVFQKAPYFVRLFIILALVIILFGTVMHFIERETFPRWFDGLWWAIITASTVGYGDYVPTTVPGKLVASCLVFAGAGFATTFFATLARTAVKKQSALEKGIMTMRLKKHWIVIGWNERSKELIGSLSTLRPGQIILLIDTNLDRNPFTLEKNLYFLKGSPFSEETLKKASAGEAEGVLITADAKKSELSADMQTILTIVAIRGHAPNVQLVAEILTEGQIINAKRAGADRIIPANKILSRVMVNEVFDSRGTSPPVSLTQFWDETILIHEDAGPFAGRPFRDAVQAFLPDGKILIGFQRNGTIFPTPKAEERILAGDRLLFLVQNSKMKNKRE